ncbi:MAG TPA: tetratricopeptide repeat protein [Bacteroidales bacterium]|nr:tetratricopeptide repeat protein [Bacteroidales bacterium]
MSLVSSDTWTHDSRTPDARTHEANGLIVAITIIGKVEYIGLTKFHNEVVIMEVAKTIMQHKRINKLVSERRLKPALDLLSEMISSTQAGNLSDEYENIVMTYKNMLTYTVDGVPDPERHKVYIKLIQSILTIADRVKQDILSRNSGWHTYWVKQQAEKELRLSGKTIIDTVDDLVFKSELDEWLKISREAIQNPHGERTNRHNKLIKNIFNHLWLTDYYGDAENSLIRIIQKSDNFRWHERCIFTTAITLSSLRTWQAEKLYHLAELYQAGENMVHERALTGLVLNLYYYNGRINLYQELTEKLLHLSFDDRFREHCRIIILQTIRSRETEKLGKKLHDEILPKVEKLKPLIEEKLDLDNILPDYRNNEKNPDWSDMFSDSDDVFKSMEELTKLQMEGADVYMTAFANMKHFDFFKDFQNWFVPFYPGHETMDEIYKDEILGPGTNELAEALYRTPFICNSDKYSLLLNLKQLPASQKTMMLKVFRMELEGLQQLNEEESITDTNRNFRINATQYIQDIYRFFKLSPYRKEFEDIFSGKLDIYNSEFFRLVFRDTETETSIADFFFSRDFYDDALALYLKQASKNPSDAQIYEKTGYCYQELGDYQNALKYYKLAELIDRKPWTIKKAGLCLKKLGRTEEALDYYLEACDLEPDNLHSVMMAGHCYLDLKKYEEALKYYFRIEYSDPENIKILRPIAYCYFALGKFEESEKYYDRMAEKKLNAHDQINRGHLALCRGNRREAINFYRQAVTSGELTKDQFIEIFNSDSSMLTAHGVDPEDLPIIVDYLLFV